MQVYIKIMEMKMMQSTKYNFQPLEFLQRTLRQQQNTSSEDSDWTTFS